jgi:hypothetical protein
VNAPLPPSFAGRPDPLLGQVRQIQSAGTQDQQALEITFKGKVGKIVSGLAQYTFSRTDNNTDGINFFPANNSNPLAEWGPAYFDQPHRLNLLGTLALPFAKIGVSAQAASGKPYTITTGIDSNNDGFVTDRPAGVGRNNARAPGYAQLDLSVSRDLFFDKTRREKGPTGTLGVSAFNIFNTFHAATIDGNQSSPFFGEAITALPARRVQITARMSF